MTREERIRHERAAMRIPPWGFAPSEVDDGPCPYSPTSAGGVAWAQAQAWRAEILERDPNYFDQ